MQIDKARGRSLKVLAAAAFCLFAAATPVAAQRGGSRPTAVDRRVAEMNRQQQEHERDRQSSELKGRGEKPADPKRAQATIAQVKEDFERLQSVYNEIVRSMTPRKALDYKFISGATAVVHKCASRLKNNLALPQPEEGESDRKEPAAVGDDAQLKDSLLTLLRHIASFATNPLFASSGGLDIELSNKASRDLQMIIELSDQLRKWADKLGKSH